MRKLILTHAMVIFWQRERDLEKRNGTETDVVAIRDTFEQLNFEVEIFDNLTYDAIQARLRDIQANEEELACLALFILTHGEQNGTLQAYDKPFRLDK